MTRASPIIVGGCHRSGTSLVRRLLNAHSAIHCGPEVKFFRDFFGDYPDDTLKPFRFLATARSILPEDELLEIAGAAFVAIHERAARRAGKRRWADKAPENVLHLAEWRRILGDDWLLDFAKKHCHIIARFGRFPHRNAILGRAPRADEIAAGDVVPW